MPKTENIIEAILDAISQDIAEQEKAGQEAMKILEKDNMAKHDYFAANIQIGISVFVSRYLGHIKSCIRIYNDAEKAEEIIRYHAYRQKEMFNLHSVYDDITAGQRKVTSILLGYISRFFN